MSEPDGEELPSRIGPYRVDGVLGRGGMGVVYRARGPSGPVALKVLLSRSGKEPELRLRFEQEARLRIEHPNVVRTLDSGVDGGLLYIAFELLEGRTLAAHLDAHGMLSLPEVVSLGREAASGLAAAHASGVVHRDLKPSNLFLADDGAVKIVDFGIARMTERDTRLTATGHLVGTAAYLSPEQARGEALVDARSDVWSLGVVLYEALTGRNPFDRGTMMATMLAVIAELPPPVGALRRDVPIELGRVIARCLERAPDRRFRDGAALLAALETIEPGEHTTDVCTDATVRSHPMPGSALPPGEQRVVAIVLAEAVRDRRALAAAIEGAGGVLMPLGDRALGVFGSTAWEGDEIDRAARAAIAVRGLAGAVAVASGRASYSGVTGIAGDVLEAAEAGCRETLDGVALDESSTRALRDRWRVRLREGGGELEGEEIGAGMDTATARTLAPPSHGVTLGRDAELAQMRRAVQTLDEGSGAVALLVVGPPGAGKSHLRWEMAGILERESHEPPLLLSARAEPLDRGARLSLFRELLLSRAWLGHEREGWPSIDRSASSAERRAAVGALAREVGADPAFVGELLGVAVDGGGELTAARRDPRLMADRLRLTISDWLVGLADARPVALLLDDLQWADEASLDLLEEVIAQLADAPLFVLACARPELEEDRPHFLASILAARIEPRPLLASEVQALASALTGVAFPSALARRLAERTGGNPLFVEQIVRALAPEAWHDESSFPLPLTVEAAVQSRLDHLPSAEKELCKLAAVVKRAFTPEELAALGVYEPRPLLGALVRREVLVTRGRSRGLARHQFRSALVRDVAYGMLGAGIREELHARLAEHLASLEDADAEEIAGHFEQALQSSNASTWYETAAKAASRRGDPAGTLRNAERALALGGELGRCGLHLLRSDAYEVMGDLEGQSAALEGASHTATSELERARVAIDSAVWSWRTGRAAEAHALAREAVDAARRSGDREALALSLGRSAVIQTYSGALDDAERALAEADPIARSEGPMLQAHAAIWRAQLANARGDQAARRAAYRDAAVLYDQLGDVRRAAGAELNLADAANRVGAYEEAERALRAAREKALRVGNVLYQGYASLNLGYAALALGREADAREALELAQVLAERTGEARLGVLARIYSARAHLASPEEARLMAMAAEREANDRELTGLRVLALTVAAAAALAAGRTDEALDASERALALRDELGAVEEDEGDVFLVRAQALEAKGAFIEGREVRTRGRARVRELADRITDEDLRARFMADVPAHRELFESE